MIITPDSHPDGGIMSISAPNHHAIKDIISAIQYKFASTKSGC